MACLIDAIELLPGVEDKDLAAFFAMRELNDATACETSISDGVAGSLPPKTP